MSDKKKMTSGKRDNQKLKAYLVMKLLQEHTDPDNLMTASDIADYLCAFGISAEQKSINNDIKSINAALEFEKCFLDKEPQYEYDISEAIADIENNKDLRTIVYKSASVEKRGYYYRHEEGYLEELRLLLESVYSSKFISKKTAILLEKRILKDVSIHDREKLTHITPIISRSTANKNLIFDNVKIISDAMSKKVDGKPHKPEKIQFNYQEYYIPEGGGKPAKRNGRKNELYVVSPYHLMINNGNYYLLCYDDKNKKKWTYRVDRMINVLPIGAARDGAEAFVNFNAEEYAKQNFSMFEGENKHIKIRFVNTCLNAVVEQFGTGSNIFYQNVDSKHFTVSLTTGINKQFYGWICTFGNKAKIIEPAEAVNEFKNYISKIYSTYEE